MKTVHTLLCAVVALLLLGGCASAGTFSAEVDRAQLVVADAKGNRFAVEIGHSIDGFEVDCKQRWAVVWGKALQLNPSNPQDTEVTLIQLDAGRVRGMFGYSKGIFDVQFSADGRYAILHSDRDQLLDLDRAQGVTSTAIVGESQQVLVEECSNFGGRSFRRYR